MFELGSKILMLVWMPLLCMAWLQTSFFPPWVAFHGEIFGFLSIIFLSTAALKKKFNLTMSLPELLLVSLIFFILIQRLINNSILGGDVIVYLLYLLGMIFTIGFVRNCNGFEELLIRLAWVILFAGICSVYVAAMQSTHIDADFEYIVPMNSWRRPGANMAQPNNLGTLLNWAFASAIYLFLRKKLQIKITIIISAFLLLGLSMTESRAALLGVLAVTYWIHAVQLIKNKQHRWIVSMVLSIFVMALFFFWPKIITIIQEGGWNLGVLNENKLNTQIGARLNVWPQLLRAVMLRPIMGWGVGGVSAALSTVLNASDVSLPFSYSHNLIVDCAIWFGLPVALTITCLFLFWFFGFFKKEGNISNWYAMALLLPFLLHSLFEFPFAYSYFLFPACVAVAVLDSSCVNVIKIKISYYLVLMLFVGWVFLGAIVVRDYVLIEEDFRIARMEALKIGHTPVAYERPHVWLLNQLEIMNAATRSIPKPGMAEDEIDLLRMAALRFPWTSIQNRYALALALNNNIMEAKRQLEVLKAMQGAKTYEAVKGVWIALADEKYPQLNEFIAMTGMSNSR